MDEELRALYLEKLKADVNSLENLEKGSKEWLVTTMGIEKLTKLLMDDFKNQQAAWDREQAREMNERIKMAQAAADEKKAVLDVIGRVAGPIAGGIFSLLGTRYLAKFIKAMNDGGYLPDREVMKLMPKFKFW